MTAGRYKLLLGLLLLLLLVLLGVFNLRKPRILVLHSRGLEAPWVRGVDRGLRRVLATNRIPVTVEWNYLGLDAKRPGQGMMRALATARRTIQRLDPHLVIAIDDEANAFVARDFSQTGGRRILYVSIDRDPRAYGYEGDRKISGIAERLPLAPIMELARWVRPDRSLQIHALGSASETSRGSMVQVRDFNWAPHRFEEALQVRDFEELQAAVRRFETGILLVLDCPPLPRRGGGWASAREVVEEIQRNSKAIPVGLSLDFVELGGDIAFVAPPEANGSLAMTMALEWVQDLGPAAAPPPARTMSHFDLALRPSRLRIRGFEVPQIYVEAARAAGMLFP
jgi:hypothetical protein